MTDRDDLEDQPAGDRRGSEVTGDASTPRQPDGDGVVLSTVPDGYAAEAVVFEWLSMLVGRTGPAGALRAVDHYYDVGWISPSVRDRLVEVLSGPGLDVHVDPRQPVEPTAAEHAESYEYVATLAELAET